MPEEEKVIWKCRVVCLLDKRKEVKGEEEKKQLVCFSLMEKMKKTFRATDKMGLE